MRNYEATDLFSLHVFLYTTTMVILLICLSYRTKDGVCSMDFYVITQHYELLVKSNQENRPATSYSIIKNNLTKRVNFLDSAIGRKKIPRKPPLAPRYLIMASKSRENLRTIQRFVKCNDLASAFVQWFCRSNLEPPVAICLSHLSNHIIINSLIDKYE